MKIKNVNKELLLNTRFWFAASIHKDEEEFCLKTHLELKKKFSDILTIIAPRHIDRSKRIISLSDNLSLSSQILSKDEAILKGKEIIIINYFGALQKYFKYAKSTFLGKSIIVFLLGFYCSFQFYNLNLLYLKGHLGLIS